MQEDDGAGRLAGELHETPFPQVLAIVSRRGSTGRLAVDGGGTPREMAFAEGRLVAIDGDWVSDDRLGWVADVVLELCALNRGSYRFAPDLSVPALRGVGADEVLAVAERRVAEWQEVTRHVPSTRAVPRLAPRAPRGDAVVVEAADWPVLAVVDGHRTVGDVIVAVGRTAFEVCATLARLVVAGIVVLDESDG